MKGDIVIILAYQDVPDGEARSITPKLVYVDAKNNIVETKRGIKTLTLLEAE
jgi:aspartate 1-decarboxylase